MRYEGTYAKERAVASAGAVPDLFRLPTHPFPTKLSVGFSPRFPVSAITDEKFFVPLFTFDSTFSVVVVDSCSFCLPQVYVIYVCAKSFSLCARVSHHGVACQLPSGVVSRSPRNPPKNGQPLVAACGTSSSYGPGLVTGGVLSGWRVAMRRAVGCSGCVTVVRCGPVPRVAIAPLIQLPSGIRVCYPVSCCEVVIIARLLCSLSLMHSSYYWSHAFRLVANAWAFCVCPLIAASQVLAVQLIG
jgi:hypothetical protein